MDDEDGDDTAWTIDHIGREQTDAGVIPNRSTTTRLIREYRDSWVVDAPVQQGAPVVHVANVLDWLCRRLRYDPTNFRWADFDAAHKAELGKLAQLKVFLTQNRLDGDPKQMLYETSAIVANVASLMKHGTRMLVNLSPRSLHVHAWVAPEELNCLDAHNENLFDHDPSKNTAFQNVFFHLREVLEGCRYRRARGKFFQRIVTPGGRESHAYEIACTVEQFILDHTAADSNFQPFRWITNPAHNYKHMVEFLKERNLPEAPDLDEDRHKRVYAGDDVGRGAGIYDHAQDMFFPYDRMDEWPRMAADVQRVRRRLRDPRYECVAPAMDTVCVTHLSCAFPFDVHADALEAERVPLGRRWVEVGEFMCRHERHRPGADLRLPALADLLAQRADAAYDPAELERQFPRPRLEVTEEEWVASGGGDPSGVAGCAYVTNASRTRCFRVDVGTMWFDIPTVDLDHIYYCQDFVEHDRFFLWGVKGRVFYKVNERDRCEGTVFFEGIGGCGKSTITKVFQRFWPAHRRGVLSSNLQPQFGMAEVAHGDVAWCTEMSEEPGMPQEDWQDATGGHTVLCPIKHKQEPLVVENWHAQFWWCGNRFPKSYRNGQGQVTRRIYGVAMYKAVKPRKDDVLGRIMPHLGRVQRKAILAYDEWLLQQGNIDPNSEVHNLPPAFAWYHRKTRQDTDPVEQFLCDTDYVVEDEKSSMPMSVFRALYNQFRIDKEMPKSVRWSEDVYRIPFSERCLEVTKHVSYEWKGERLTDVAVVAGLRPRHDD